MIRIAGLLASFAILAFLPFTPAQAREDLPRLQISGSGAQSGSRIVLNFSPQTSLTAIADKSGEFSFQPFAYDFLTPLSFTLHLPVSGSKGEPLHNNAVMLTMHPGSSVKLQGNVTKAASIAFAVNGTNSEAAVANNKGFFRIFTAVDRPLTSRQASLVLNILNTEESCCPRMITPTLPLTVAIQGTGGMAITEPPPLSSLLPPIPAPSLSSGTGNEAREEPPKATSDKKGAAPPPQSGKELKPPKPIFLSPIHDHGPDFDPAPDLRSGSVEMAATYSTDTRSYAVAADNWVQGLRQMTDPLIGAMMVEALAIGGFIDAKIHLDSQLLLQRLTAQAMKDYTPSEAVCQFGTLTRSLALAQEHSRATQLTVSQAMIDRDLLRKFSVGADHPSAGGVARVRHFQRTYCLKSAENEGLRKFCSAAVVGSGVDRDVNYTRVFDQPTTLNVDFTSGAPSATGLKANAEILALGNNLFSSEAFGGFTSEDMMKAGLKSDDIQNFRSLSAIRSVARNSFTQMVGLKARGANASCAYIRQVLYNLGMNADEANAFRGTRICGEGASYFAQMEILTKKVFQNPSFFVDLYDKPANVERQRVAMLAIKLQQDADLLDSLKRREMLLSVLLEMKLRNPKSGKEQ